MKILMSAYACEPNKGSEHGVGWHWATYMAKYNDVWVITRKSNREEIEKELSINPIKNLNFIYCDLPYYLRFWKKGNRGVHLYYKIWQKIAYYKVKKIKKYNDFDIVHHVTFNEFRTPGLLWKMDIPFVWGPIGGAQEIPQKFEEYYQGYKVKEKIRSYLNKKYIKSKSVKKASNKASMILFANEETSTALELLHLENKSMRLLETAIDKEKISFAEKIYEEKEKFTLMWAGNLIYRKALGILLEALSDINIKDRIVLNVIGDGPMRKKYEQYCKENNLEKIVNFVGKVSYNDMQNYYKNADIFIFTSLRDTSGNVVLEAMSNELPIITLDHNGVKDIVTEECGFKIKVTNPNKVKNDIRCAIETLVNDSDLRKTMGTASKRRIINNYTWEKSAEIMQNIYEQVISLNYED